MLTRAQRKPVMKIWGTTAGTTRGEAQIRVQSNEGDLLDYKRASSPSKVANGTAISVEKMHDASTKVVHVANAAGVGHGE